MTPTPRLVPDRPSDAAIAQALCSSLAIDCENLPDFVLAHAREIDAAARALSSAERGDDFEGDNAHLIECIDALVSLNDSGALVPHGIGGHARKLLLAAASRLAAAPAGECAHEWQPDADVAGAVYCPKCDCTRRAAPAAPATEHRAATPEEEAAIDAAVGLVKVVLRFPTLLHCTLTAEAEERGIAFPALIREKLTAPRVTGGRAAIPAGVYYSPNSGNFHKAENRNGMGGAFFQQWFSRRLEFPLTPEEALQSASGGEAGSD